MPVILQEPFWWCVHEAVMPFFSDADCYCLQPQDAYGLEKLASEELAKHYDTDFGIECRIARYMFPWSTAW